MYGDCTPNFTLRDEVETLTDEVIHVHDESEVMREGTNAPLLHGKAMGRTASKSRRIKCESARRVVFDDQ